jgi:hypothetical protein
MADKPETKRRRLKGPALGNLRKLMKKLDAKVKSLNEVRHEIIDAHDLFMDQVNWMSSIIFDASEKTKDREPIGRIATEEARREYAARKEVDRLDSLVGDLKWDYAGRLGCLPKDINPESGEITGTPVDGVDPFEEKECDHDSEELQAELDSIPDVEPFDAGKVLAAER